MYRSSFALIAGVLMLSSCAGDSNQRSRTETARDQAQPSSAKVELQDAKGANVGSATLTSVDGGVRISGHVMNLPAGKLGIHIHQNGVCTPPDFKTAGDHLNPTGAQHGSENPMGPHLGDLGNITVGSDGTGNFEVIAKNATLAPGSNSLLPSGGTTLMIHAKEDDQKTDPSGNSGERIACGVIQAQ